MRSLDAIEKPWRKKKAPAFDVGDTVTVNGVDFVVGIDWLAGGDLNSSASNLATAIEVALPEISAQVNAATIDLTVRTPGAHGNDYTLSVTDFVTANFSLSGGNFINGEDTVVQAGIRTALEKYFGRASRNVNPDMASTGKAYTSIACGIMMKEFRGKIPDGLETKVFTQKFLPEAISADGSLDDPRRADITLGQLLCMSGGYTGEGGAPTAVVMGKAFPLKAVPGQNIRDVDGSSLRCAMLGNRFRARRSMKAAWAGMMGFDESWKW